jgi:hypothetical protein
MNWWGETVYSVSRQGAVMDLFRGWRGSFICAALSLFLFGSGSVIDAVARSRPVLVVSNSQGDAGDVCEGEHVSQIFEVRNTGDAVLNILSVKPG